MIDYKKKYHKYKFKYLNLKNKFSGGGPTFSSEEADPKKYFHSDIMKNIKNKKNIYDEL